ncbi:hypothetical protein [Oscillibacter sp.]|uniref:hypothetical protein n=1 Tax=Oscillibacter sp. TaxID=1945593 RepID=UPI0028A704D9|nr:hypothetical protein [Oscillibacter sp.]
MNQTLNAFLTQGNLDALAYYDLKNESPWDNANQKQNPIQKFLRYKDNNKGSQHFDCDGSGGTCALTDDLYKRLWGWSYKGRYQLPEELAESMGAQWNRFGPDTMNSFMTIYRVAQRLYSQNKNAIPKNPYISKFAVLTHTIGNFTLVPFQLNPQEDQGSFNQSRGFRGRNGSKYFVYDFFDLSLKIIQENTEDFVFRAYIDTFFLNDYVDEEYNVLPLFSRHKWYLEQEQLPLEKPEDFLPANKIELDEYLENVICRIEARGKRMVDELTKQDTGGPFAPEGDKLASPEVPVIADIKEAVNTPQPTKAPKKPMPKWLKYLIGLGVIYVGILITIAVLDTISLCAPLDGFSNAVRTEGLFNVLGQVWTSCAGGWIERAGSYTFNFIIALFLLRLLAIHFANKHLERCKNCGKVFAVNRITHDILGRDDISIMVELKDRGSDGFIRGTHEQYIPGIRTWYEDTYKCGFCGNTVVEKYHCDTKKI